MKNLTKDINGFMDKINVGIIGCGGITFQNHIPGLKSHPDAEVYALCDSSAEVLEHARAKTGIERTFTDYKQLLQDENIHAVIVATPNFTHYQIVMEAIAAGKHVLCEKPLAMNYRQAKEMADAAEKADIRHMTAFTYRFVPAMRYMRFLINRGDIGRPYHYRSCRLQDWGDRYLGWRQFKETSGTGEIGDMLSHRIDFAHFLVGEIDKLVANTKIFHPFRGNKPNELDDWVGVIADFKNGATGILESSKLATGRGESWQSLDYVEVNGEEGTIVYLTEKWNSLLIGKKGRVGLETIYVPEEFWKLPASQRNPLDGNPLITFRYDQAVSFIEAIKNQTPCEATFSDGAKVQAVMDAIIESVKTKHWVSLSEITGSSYKK